MGDYHIRIHGVGPNHNDKPNDAERIAAECVDVLRLRGHVVQAASVDAGERRTNVLALPPLKGEDPPPVEPKSTSDAAIDAQNALARAAADAELPHEPRE